MWLIQERHIVETFDWYRTKDKDNMTDQYIEETQNSAYR